MSKKDRVRLLAFYRIRGEVKAFGARGHLLEPIGTTLEEWLSLTEDQKKLKVEFAETAAKNRK